MKNNLLVLLVSSLPIVASAQEVGSFARLGVGTLVSPDFFQGIGTEVEGGVSYMGIHASVSLSLLNTLPLEGTHQFMSFHSKGSEEVVLNGVNRDMSGWRNTSVMVNVGYDLLCLIHGNQRHHLIPYVGIGWSGQNTVKSYLNQPIASSGSDITYGSSVEYAYSSSFDFALGARYEFSVTEKWGVGISYKYLDMVESDLLGVYASYHF